MAYDINPENRNRSTGNPDVIIIGAGVFGLSAALRLRRAGQKVLVLERAHPGAGASGGLLGALAPYVPGGWSAKKQFQLAALHELASVAERLEADTGFSIGYARCGRVQPLFEEAQLALAQTRVAASHVDWRVGGAHYQMQHVQTLPLSSPGLAPAPFGYLVDTLSGRLDPVAYCSALQQACRLTEIEIRSASVVAANAAAGGVLLADGTKLTANQVVIAAGDQSFALLQASGYPLLGHGVPGSVFMMRPTSELPKSVIYTKGCYIVPHQGHRIVVGSTTEAVDEDVQSMTERRSLLAAATRLLPALADLKVEQCWRGVRPNAALRAPMVGHLDGRLWVATGGYGIGLGIAHRVARVLCAKMLDQAPIDHPANFDPAVHLAAVRGKEKKQV